MPDPRLDAIVQRMIDAGEPEENIATVIQGYAPANPAAPTAAASSGRDDPMGYLGAMAGNIPESAGNLVTNTLSGVAALGKGLYNDPMGTLGGIGRASCRERV